MAERKGKKQKRKREKKNKSSYYTVEGNTLKRNKKSCQKCGAGIFMAEHKDRYSCGCCGYMETKK